MRTVAGQLKRLGALGEGAPMTHSMMNNSEDRGPRSGSSAAPAFNIYFHGQRRFRWAPPSFRVGGVWVGPVLEKILRPWMVFGSSKSQ